MKKIIFVTIFIAVFCAFAFGQNTEKSVCPTVSVREKSAPVRAGEDVVFSASVEGFSSRSLEYVWFVSDGNMIVDGQGTDTLTVRSISGDGTTVTVEIKGLPEGCPNTDSDSVTMFCGPYSILIDEVELLLDPVDEERLDNWFAEIEDDPSAQIYVIIYNNQKFPPKKFKEKIAYIKKYLFDKNIKETDRLVIHTEDKGDDEMNNKIRIFIVPQGADAPTP